MCGGGGEECNLVSADMGIEMKQLKMKQLKMKQLIEQRTREHGSGGGGGGTVGMAVRW